MNIPADVKTQAHDALRVDCNEDDEYAVIAEWVRKETLREAEKAIRAHQPEYPAREDHDYYALGRHDGFAQAAAVTRALAGASS